MGERIRVLWLIKGLGLGGAERLLVNALPCLDRDRFEYRVGYFLPWKDALVGDLEAAGLPVECFGIRREFDLRAVTRVRRYLRQHQIDVLHAHLPWSSLVGRAAAKLAGTPAVIYTEHGCWDRLNPLTRRINQSTLGWNDVTIAVSEDVRKSIVSPSGHDLRMILNGVDVEGLAATPDECGSVRAELGIPSGNLIVGKVANLSPVKNHELLVRAFARFHHEFPQSTLVLVGQLRDRDAMLRSLAEELGCGDSLVITGPRDDVPRLLRCFDVFAMSSHSEGLPVSLLEAMSMGKPVVCTQVGGIPGVVDDGRNGYLVPAGDHEMMADRFLKLAQDAELRLAMGAAGAELVRRDYDVSVMVREVEQLYLDLMDRKRD